MRSHIHHLSLLALVVVAAFSSACAAPAGAPSSFGYVLQAEKLGDRAEAIAKLTASGRDWLVLDASFDGSADGAWTTPELAQIRAGKPGRKIVSYLSIGEAETYRPYWKKAWDAQKDGKPDAGAPEWLRAVNPAWSGNYRVSYWDPQWQALILPEVQRLMAVGFDGLYLDIVDGFEFFEQSGKKFIDDRENPATKQSYRRDMVAWVQTVATTARKARPEALIIPQNGYQLLHFTDFAATISACGVEDVFSDGGKPQDEEHTDAVIAAIRASGRPALTIDYPKSSAQSDTVRKRAHAAGLTFLITNRALSQLGESGQ
jgi:cysteinyl-tRNA synthetase, unknown class